ncbi:MAG: hypothetical protein J6K84_04785 [Oscillospiraceae bacterium]|nr:hypothetical protein [Oscillospiraceae bacterium]
MISTDLSNVWRSVSLPELLQEEQTIFDAHLLLGGGRRREDGWLSFLEEQDTARPRWLEEIIFSAQGVKEQSEYLLVVGGGLTQLGLKALTSLSLGTEDGCRLLFCGEDVSPQPIAHLERTLRDKKFSILVMSATGEDPFTLITLRTLRRLMEDWAVSDVRERIYISAPEVSSLGQIALAEGFLLLPYLSTSDASESVLNPAGLFALSAAGYNVKELCRGAATAMEEYALRSFENPLWLYVGSRLALRDRGFFEECLCLTDYRAQMLGTWWKALNQKAMGRGEKPISLETALLPRELSRCGDGLFATHRFYTMIRLPMDGVSIPVEMDWKDLDGYNSLSGKDFAHVEKEALAAIDLNLAQKQIPVISLEWEGRGTVGEMGALAVFLELSAVLTAVCSGASPFLHTESDAIYHRLDTVLERNFSNLSN